MTNTPIPFIDLKAQQVRIRDEIESALKRVLDHGQYIMGPEIAECETALKDFCGARHALTCGNGTDALTLALMAWEVGAGDAVFVPSFTFVATAETVAQLGATPVFVDVDSDSFNMDAESFKQAIINARELGLTPKAVIPVDLFGLPVRLDALAPIARESGVHILVDSAQSFGGVYKGGRVGGLPDADATTTSFFPAKPLGCYGDGGAVFTNDDALATRLNSVRLHGQGATRYDHEHIGINSRLDSFQAAVLIEKLKIFPDELEARTHIAARYSDGLSNVVTTPQPPGDSQSAWAQYTIRTDGRDALQATLGDANIPSVIYYPTGIADQPAYRAFPRVSTGLAVSETLSRTVLSLPMHPYLEADAQARIIDAITTHRQKDA